ncbi:MAG: hypothetical protein PHN63_02930 [Candidatus Omnitrophica bacterium]|nr:hypothetical protein [Candidatus Omnitrophota bacterium]
MNIKLTERQKKTFMVAGMIGGAFFLFIVFVYVPMARELAALKKDYDRTISDIGQIKKTVVGERGSLEETINRLNRRLDVLNNMFPSQEEGILNVLSRTAAKFKINVISTNPEKKHAIQEIGQTPIAIKECVVQKMEVAMIIRTDYKTAVEFIRAIRDDFPTYIKFNSIRMEKVSDDRHPLLKIELNMLTYLVCAKAPECHG